jgi:hypothetical protein
MNASRQLDDKQWSDIDPHILVCDQASAYWQLRVLTGASPDEAQEAVRLRYKRLHSTVPERFAWNRFPCRDYLASEWADQGCWDDASQTMLIRPAWNVTIREDIELLVIGGPGSDGIVWGYRIGHTGLWVYYPIDHAFIPVAVSAAELVERWTSGDLAL